MTLIIVIAIVAVVALWFVSVQRKLVSQEELVKNAMSQIGVQQQSRWDALSALADLVKGYNEHEYKTITETISMRQGVGRNSTAAEVDAQEDLIGKTLSRIVATAEAYPELKANENYKTVMESVNTYENQVRTSRMVYNDTVTKFNKVVRQFPESFAASLLGFKEKDYLKEVAGKTEMPSFK